MVLHGVGSTKCSFGCGLGRCALPQVEKNILFCEVSAGSLNTRVVSILLGSPSYPKPNLAQVCFPKTSFASTHSSE